MPFLRKSISFFNFRLKTRAIKCLVNPMIPDLVSQCIHLTLMHVAGTSGKGVGQDHMLAYIPWISIILEE